MGTPREVVTASEIAARIAEVGR
ncbi:MAG: hypothetical protein H6Q02_1086, partial [Acidobacteria bacterium]|nr:hypothetical protein [Acidobacteriota bacterium]